MIFSNQKKEQTYSLPVTIPSTSSITPSSSEDTDRFRISALLGLSSDGDDEMDFRMTIRENVEALGSNLLSALQLTSFSEPPSPGTEPIAPPPEESTDQPIVVDEEEAQEISNQTQTLIEETKQLTSKAKKRRTIDALKKLALVIVFYIVGVLFYNSYEDWDILTCVYFITISSTTVGYGDYHPTSNYSRLFTMFYLFFGIIGVIDILSQVMENFYDYLHRKFWKTSKKLIDQMGVDMDDDDELDPEERMHKEIERLFKRIITLTCVFFAEIWLTACFLFKYEGWNFLQCMYFSFVTLVTVGYGDLVPQDPRTRVFLIFVVLFNMSLLGALIKAVASVGHMINTLKIERELLSAKLDAGAVHNMDLDGDDAVSRFEYVLIMLVKTGVIDPNKHINPWLENFDELDQSGDGKLDRNDFSKVIHHHVDKHLEKKKTMRKVKLTLFRKFYDAHL